MRLFGGEMIQKLANSGRFPEDEALEFKSVTSAIERAQKKIESSNFSIRKNTLQYDDVMNVQRLIIYKERKKVLDGEDIRDNIMGMLKDVVNSTVDSFLPDNSQKTQSDLIGLLNHFKSIYLPQDAV